MSLTRQTALHTLGRFLHADAATLRTDRYTPSESEISFESLRCTVPGIGHRRHPTRAWHSSASRNSKLSILHYSEYVCAEYPDLATVLRSFVDTFGNGEITRAAIAIAGLQDGDTLINPNLPWRVSLSQTRNAVNLQDLAIINDFEALAHAVPHIDVSGAQLLTGKPVAVANAGDARARPGHGLSAPLCAFRRNLSAP